VYRFTVFPDKPEHLLVTVVDDEQDPLRIELGPVFTKECIQEACRVAGVEPAVTEGVPGRWTHSMIRAHTALRSARASRAKEAEAVRAMALRSSPVPVVRDHATALFRKNEVDARIRELKDELERAKREFHRTGVSMEPRMFHEKHRNLGRLKQESQVLQTRLGELRRAEKAANIKRARQEGNTLLDQFKKAAYHHLDRDVFMALVEEAEAMVKELSDDQG